MDSFDELRKLEKKHRRHFSTLQQAMRFDAKQREFQSQATEGHASTEGTTHGNTTPLPKPENGLVLAKLDFICFLLVASLVLGVGILVQVALIRAGK